MYRKKVIGEQSDPIHPMLKRAEHSKVEERTAPRAIVVHEAIRAEGEEELSRPSQALAWSGLAAGLSMGFSLVAEGLIRGHLPPGSWVPLLAKFGYTVGFLIVILGRQHLFTENTLTVILPLLASRRVSTLINVLRLWAIVLAANLLGTLIFAWVVGNTNLFPAEIRTAFGEIGMEAAQGDFGTVVIRSIFGGWLIALMVWMLPAAGAGRVAIIIIVTYLVGLGGFSHIVAGSVETLYLVTTGAMPALSYLGSFMLPTLIGNIIGGVSLVAALNYAQVAAGEDRE